MFIENLYSQTLNPNSVRPVGFVCSRDVDAALRLDALLVVLHAHVLLRLCVPSKSNNAEFRIRFWSDRYNIGLYRSR